jgi:hypothetical protein
VSKKPPEQIAFAFAGDGGDFVLTRPLARHRRRGRVVEKLRYVRRFFPELEGQIIRVGLTRSAAGLAVPGGAEVWVNPSQTSYQTLAHEFIHLLQGRHDIPGGERSCDVFALARHWTLNDSPPYYVRLPKEYQTVDGRIRHDCARLIYEIARHAVGLRRVGTRNYIAYFEETLERLRRAPPPARTGADEWGGAESARRCLQMDEPLATPDGDPFD